MTKEFVWNLFLKVMGRNIDKEYTEIKNTIPMNDFERLKVKYLEYLLIHAHKNVPYYNRVFNKMEVVDNGTVNLLKFDKIPIITKETLQIENLSSREYRNRKWYYNSSGGSTGEPTRFIQDEEYTKWFQATSKYYYQEMLGIDETRAKKIILWGSPRDLFKGNVGVKNKISNWFNNCIFLNSFKMSKNDLERYLRIINSEKPDIIKGYAGSLYELGMYAENANINIRSPKLLISSAETLSDEMRQKIESIFGAKTFDFYGSRETASIAGECRCGLMHQFIFNNYVEILDDNNNPVKNGEMGKIIITNLHNYAMPFIRYEIGDAAIPGGKKCKCGNTLPTMKKIAGRLQEQFVKENGTIIIGYFFVHLMGVIQNKGLIKKFQIIQEEYKKIRIIVVPKTNINKVERTNIENKIKTVMGNDCKIVWDFVDDIQKTEGGKYFYTKSLVKR